MEQWTDERRAYYVALIRARKPWEKSTGPTTNEGKNKSSRNAKKIDAPNYSSLEKLKYYLQGNACLSARYTTIFASK